MRQIAFAQQGTAAFMQAFVAVVHLKIDTHTNQLSWCKKNLSDSGRLCFHTQNMAFSFRSFRPTKEALQQSNTHSDKCSETNLNPNFQLSFPRKFARLVLFHLIKKHSFNLVCVLDLFSERWQSTLFQIFLVTYDCNLLFILFYL